MRGRLVTLALLLVIGGALAAWVANPWDSEPAYVAPWQQIDPDPALTLGVTTDALAFNARDPWEIEDLVEVNRFEQQARHHAGIVMWFADWESGEFDPERARAVAERGSVPAISWEPWDASDPAEEDQPEYRLRTILDGEHDETIVRWARDIAAYGDPVRVRFAHEMNGRWYPWAEKVNGNRPGEYVEVWRHVRDIFRREGADNVTWIWSPVTGNVERRFFPGVDEVDVVGLAGFNGGSELFRREWRSFSEEFGAALRYLEFIAPGVPIEISEVASAEVGGDKAAWIRGMFDEIAQHPAVESVVWFNAEKETDWRITSSEAARRAFAAGFDAALARAELREREG